MPVRGLYKETHVDIFSEHLGILVQQRSVGDLDLGMKPSEKSLRPRGVEQGDLRAEG